MLGVLGVGVRAVLPDVCSGSMPHVRVRGVRGVRGRGRG